MWRPWRIEWTTAALAAGLGTIYLLLPLMGSDLSAQTARAGFFAEHGYTPVDLRWYGGVDQLGYSLVSQPVMAFLGVRPTGAVALFGSALLFSLLLRRTNAPRPWLGSLLGAASIAGNLASGRVTYALGVLFALAAVTALTYARLTWLAVAAAVLASATSPVAGLFVGLAAAALLVCARRSRAEGRSADAGTEGAPPASSRWPGPLAVGVGATVPLVLSAGWFGDGGWMNISFSDTSRSMAGALLVALLVPCRPVRVGALLSAAGVLAAALVHTPVGLNATRLSVMFTLPVLAAYAAWPNAFFARLRPVWPFSHRARGGESRADHGPGEGPADHGPGEGPACHGLGDDEGRDGYGPGESRADHGPGGAATPPVDLAAVKRLPVSAGAGSPAVPQVAHAADPAVVTPADPAVATPADPAVATPADPAVATPADPAVAAPAGRSPATVQRGREAEAPGSAPRSPHASRSAGVQAMRRPALTYTLVAACWLQSPVVVGDVWDMGNPTADRAYFAPLLARLAQETLTGRVEIPPTRDYWEAAYLGDVPLARGWLRQADIGRNPLFFATVPGAGGTGVPLTAAAYGEWLGELAVQFVAVPDAVLSWPGRGEAELVAQGQPYLTPIWQDAHWRLYAVKDARPIVGSPGTLVDHTSAAITFTVPAAADVPVRVHYYRWLRVDGNATIERTGDWITIHARTAGKYTLTS